MRDQQGIHEPKTVEDPNVGSSFVYAIVAVDSPSGNHSGLFTYSVPEELNISAGHCVEVPFGRRLARGVVTKLTGNTTLPYTKPILRLLHPHPLISPIHIELAAWISRYYMASSFESLSPMLPPGFRASNRLLIKLSPDWETVNLKSRVNLSEGEERVLEIIRKYPNGIDRSKVVKVLGPWVQDNIQKLLNKKILHAGFANPKSMSETQDVRVLYLTAEKDQVLRWISRNQVEDPESSTLARYLLGNLPDPYPAVLARQQFGQPTISTLVKQGIAKSGNHRATPRNSPKPHSGHMEPPNVPTPDQTTALNAIKTMMADQSNPRVLLLQGVTGSGKTEVYLQALAHCIANGKRGIVLIPELSLTPQTLSRFNARFPNMVAVLHSGLTPAQQLSQWWEVYRGAYPVVLGARGAIFAPQSDLGLIIIDEEHEWTYKQQDSSPRYHAREVAARLATLTGAAVVLGTATPEINSAYRAKTGKYRLENLPSRILPGGVTSTVAPVEIVDMREELRNGNPAMFSRSLRSALIETVSSGNQALLFLNRRGSADLVQCRSCGFTIRCWECGTPYTYHGTSGLLCHHCNRHRKVPTVCPDCKGREIRFLGLGTQTVEEEVRAIIPDCRVIRWDRDSARTSQAHREMMRLATDVTTNVIVGTQMIAKGLHLPRVTLVGAILADVGLAVPDYRAAEQTFQVLCQVAGRAGRGHDSGKVIIQTFNPDHYSIQSAANQDFESFYERNLPFLRKHRYPPFGSMIRLTVSHKEEAACRREAFMVASALKKSSREWGIEHVGLIGPAPSYPKRQHGLWKWQILLRGDNPRLLLDKITLTANWAVDVDPVSTS